MDSPETDILHVLTQTCDLFCSGEGWDPDAMPDVLIQTCDLFGSGEADETLFKSVEDGLELLVHSECSDTDQMTVRMF